MQETFVQTLKLLAQKRMELTLHRISSKDPVYQESMRKVIELERQCGELSLEPGERSLINQLLETRNEANMETVNLAYLAGLVDGVDILRQLGLLEI